MARGRHYAKLSLSNAARLSFSDLCILLFMFLSLCRLCVCVFLCSHWSLVDVPLIFFCPADHVPDWQPRVLLGMVEARSVNVKKTTTTTTTRLLTSVYVCTSFFTTKKIFARLLLYHYYLYSFNLFIARTASSESTTYGKFVLHLRRVQQCWMCQHPDRCLLQYVLCFTQCTSCKSLFSFDLLGHYYYCCCNIRSSRQLFNGRKVLEGLLVFHYYEFELITWTASSGSTTYGTFVLSLRRVQ